MSDIFYHGPVVAFDLDDTLFRERDFCRSGFRFLCDPYRHRVVDIKPYPAPDELADLERKMEENLSLGLSPFDPFEEYFKRIAGEEWNIKPHIEVYRNHTPSSLNLAPGVKETLETLAAAGIRMALITDGRSGTQRQKIQALDIQRFFAPELILISGETGHEKTDSKEMFAAVVRHYPEAREFFYVGNNPRKDFYFPNLMGWTTMQVPPSPDDVHPPVDPPSPLHAPKIKLDSFTDLLHNIKS